MVIYMFPVNYLKELYKIIKRVKPDIIHSMHIQEAAYLTMEVFSKSVGIKDCDFFFWFSLCHISPFRLIITDLEPKSRTIMHLCQFVLHQVYL